MIQQITVLSKVKFNELYVALTPIQKSNSAFISINDSFDYKWPSSDNFLNLTFDDVDAGVEKLHDISVLVQPIVFDATHASQIKKFIIQNKDKTHVYVHCTWVNVEAVPLGNVFAIILIWIILSLNVKTHKYNPTFTSNYF